MTIHDAINKVKSAYQSVNQYIADLPRIGIIRPKDEREILEQLTSIEEKLKNASTKEAQISDWDKGLIETKLEWLMNDLTSIDKFFLDHEYFRWDFSPSKENLQKGFEFLTQKFDGIGYPNLLYHQVASYGKEPELGHGDRRFFVDVGVFKPRSTESPTYQIKIRPFHETNYFEILEPKVIPNEPLQKTLNQIEKIL